MKNARGKRAFCGLSYDFLFAAEGKKTGESVFVGAVDGEGGHGDVAFGQRVGVNGEVAFGNVRVVAFLDIFAVLNDDEFVGIIGAALFGYADAFRWHFGEVDVEEVGIGKQVVLGKIFLHGVQIFKSVAEGFDAR